jgi:hypothetical protein
MNSIFFNGTPMSVCKDELTEIYKMLKEPEDNIDVTEYLQSITNMEQLVIKYSEKGFIISKNTIDKAAKECQLSNQQFRISWGYFVLYLISKKIIENDDLNGPLIFETNKKLYNTSQDVNSNPEFKQFYSECGNLYCSKPNCNLKCGNCKHIKYCSVECQKKDWKRHKKMCFKCA